MSDSRRTIFVLMPFHEDFDDVYLVVRDAVGAAVASTGVDLHCLRADEIQAPGRITAQILDAIASADLLIADLSGSNPNVMYELGYGHALQKPAIIMNQDVHTSPFDVKDFRQVLYDRGRLVKDCRPSLIAAIRHVFGDGDGDVERNGSLEMDKGGPGPGDALNPVTSGSTAPLRPGDELVAQLQSLCLRLQVASARQEAAEAKRLANEVQALLSRVIIAPSSSRADNDNTAAVAGNCAVQLEKSNLPDEAAGVYRRALGLFPDYAGLHIQYCDFLLDLGQLDDARQELERARSLGKGPHDERRIQRLEVKLSLNSGASSPELAAALREEFAANPSSRLAASAYLSYLAQTGAPVEAFEAACTEFRGALPASEQWVADRMLADRLAQEDTEPEELRAIGLYEDLLDQAAHDDEEEKAHVLHNVASLHKGRGENDQARARWCEAYELRPNIPAIRAAFSQALAGWGEIEAAVAVSEGGPFPAGTV